MSEFPTSADDATAALVYTSSMGSTDRCSALLSTATEETTILWVTYTTPPSDCIEQYREAGGVGSLSIIAVGDMPTDTHDDATDVAVKSVSTPDDLTGLGITLSQALSTHEDPLVCFDSLSVLLQYVDRETAYEFLNAVTGHLYAADASALFHLDPNAHDTQTVDALGSLFDAIVECEDGEWSVRRERLLP